MSSIQQVLLGLGGKPPIEISFTGTAIDAVDRTTYTFSGLSFGATDAARRIVVGVSGTIGGSTSRSVSSVTIGGVSATKLSQAISTDGGNTTEGSLWLATVPSGTTGDVVVTWNNSVGRCGVDVFRMVKANATPYHTATDIVPASNALDANLNLVAGGAAIGILTTIASSGSVTAVWGNMTEQSDRQIETLACASSAMRADTATQTLLITATASASIQSGALALASFGPL